MQTWIDDLETNEPRVHADRTGTEIRVDWGATHLRMSLAEAVSLIDGIATVLAEVDNKPAKRRRVW